MAQGVEQTYQNACHKEAQQRTGRQSLPYGYFVGGLRTPVTLTCLGHPHPPRLPVCNMHLSGRVWYGAL